MDALEKFSSFYTDLASMRIEELASIYSDDVIFIDPIAEHVGLSAVEGYFARLLENAKYCQFEIHSQLHATNSQCMVTWTMEYKTPRMNKGKAIKVDGLTILTLKKDKIVFHRDYYDLGQMVYENVPLLGRVIKMIKRKMG
jgi:hypothetical protein